MLTVRRRSHFAPPCSRSLVLDRPPLFVPADEAAAKEWLAYRRRYRSFRLGEARGAKGEASEVVAVPIMRSSTAAAGLVVPALPRKQPQQRQEPLPLDAEASLPPLEKPLYEIDPYKFRAPALGPSSRRQWQKFRQRYRSFRLGEARGAKGELGRAVAAQRMRMVACA